MLTRLTFWFFVTIVVLTPLPYGSVHLWSSYLLVLMTGAAIALWAVTAALRPDVYTMPARRYAVPLVLLVGVVGWLLLQTTSLMPAGLHHPVWADSLRALGRPAGGGAISLDPESTILITVRIVVYAAVFWMAMHFGRSASFAKQLVWAISITGFLYATYGIWAHLSGSGQILFSEKWAYQQSLTSTFVNRNHYGVFAGLGLIATFGLLIRYLRQDARGAFDSSHSFFNSMENLKWPVFVLTVICLVIGSALLLTQSRGGVAFTALGMIVLILLLLAGGNMRKRSVLALVGTLAVGGIVMFIVSGDQFVNRLSDKSWQSNRGEIHQIAIDAIADAPLTGHGAGTFPSLFHMYRGERFPAISRSFSAAHSVYLEFAAGAGLIAAAVYFGLQLLIVVRCFRGTLVRRRNQYYAAIGCASAVLVGLHSYYDFGPQIPGVSVTFAALLGVAFAQSWPSERKNSQSGDR